LVLFVDHDQPQMVEIHERECLAPGARIAGPAVIEQPDTTSVITMGWHALVQASHEMIVEKVSIS